MKKTKRILGIFLTLFISLLFFTTKVDAASGTITINSNSQVVVGNNITFTVKVSSPVGLVALEYYTSYDSSMLTYVSGNTASGTPVFSSSTKNLTYTFTFKAKKSGTATFKFNATGATWDGDNEVSFGAKSKSIKIITQQQLQDSYSSNNNLSSLGVEGATLSPSFSANTTSYTVNLPANTESINVTGRKADSTASVSGLGKHTVEDGNNTIKIVVTAQNGQSKTYTINAIVEELDPIEVNVSEEDFTVVRKEKLLDPPSSGFEASTAKINDLEIPSLFNESANIMLIGLKDKEGNIYLYVYDEENNTYKKYNQETFKGLTLYIEDKEVQNTDNTEEITIDENTITSYTIKDDEFYYFYAINLETGKENLYRYDKVENTVQRCVFNEDGEPVVTNKNNDDIKLYQYIIIGLLAFIFLTYIIILVNLLCRGKKKNKPTNVVIVEDEIPVTENEDVSEKEIDEKVEIQEEPLSEEENTKVTDEEKERLIKESEEELNRINNEATDGDDMVDSINELFTPIDDKKKKKEKKKKESKEKKDKKKDKKKD